VIFDLDGETPVVWAERGTSGHGPGFEDALQLNKPQIILQTRRVVLLDNEAATDRGSTESWPMGSSVGRKSPFDL
jgi:hypothetical protein